MGRGRSARLGDGLMGRDEEAPLAVDVALPAFGKMGERMRAAVQ